MDTIRTKMILLVEDEVVQAMVNKAALEKYGYSVVTANSGEKAIERAAQSPTPDLILMDIDLGTGLDGTQAAEIILKDRDIPVVFLSSHTEPEIVEKTEKITSYGYVVKNSSITVLDASIKMAFKLFEANQKTEASEEYFRHSFEYAALGICLIDLNGNFLRVNRAFLEMTGFLEQEITTMNFSDLTYAEDIPLSMATMQRMLDGTAEKISVEKRYIKKDGTVFWVSVSSSLLRSKSGPLHFITQVIDIDERKQTQEALRERESNLARAEKIAKIGYWKIKLDTKEIFGSKGACDIYGVDQDHMDLANIQSMVMSRYRNQGDQALANLMAKNEPYDIQAKICRQSDGEIIDIRSIGEYDRKKNTVFGVIQDITTQKRTEAALEKSNELFQTVLDTIPLSICWKDLESVFQGCNKIYAAMVGLPDTLSIIGKTDRDMPWKPEETELFLKVDRRVMDTDQSEQHIVESAFDAHGNEILLETNKSPLHDNEGKVCGILVSCENITGRMRTEEVARSFTERVEQTMKASNIAWWEMDIGTGQVVFSKQKTDMLGYRQEDFVRYEDFMSLVHPDDWKTSMDAMKKHFSGEADKYETEYRIKTSTGEYKLFYDIGSISKRDADGKPLKVVGIVIDITNRRAKTEETRETARVLR